MRFRQQKANAGPVSLAHKGLPLPHCMQDILPSNLRKNFSYLAFWPCSITASHSKKQDRSEEHTSELQSHSDLVCRLLLEKKKKYKKNKNKHLRKKNRQKHTLRYRKGFNNTQQRGRLSSRL